MFLSKEIAVHLKFDTNENDILSWKPDSGGTTNLGTRYGSATLEEVI
jgi:hypothetical protein